MLQVGLLSVRTSEVWFVRSFRLAVISSLACYLIGVIIGGNIPGNILLHNCPHRAGQMRNHSRAARLCSI